MRSPRGWRVRAGAALLALLAVGAVACEIDFVAVEEPPPPPPQPVRIDMSVWGTHGHTVSADVHVRLPGSLPGAVVTANGVPLDSVVQTFSDGGRVLYASAPADTLDPRLLLVVRTSEAADRRVEVPLVARNGPARWLDDGDLLVPVVSPPLYSPDRHAAITVRLLDASGRAPVTLQLAVPPFPDPLVVPGTFVPDGVVEAGVYTSAGAVLDGDGVELRWSVATETRLPVPGRGPAGG